MPLPVALLPLPRLPVALGLATHGDRLIVDPALPRRIGHLELLDLPGCWKRADAFGRGRIDMDGLTSR